jgi:hypothetical protein
MPKATKGEAWAEQGVRCQIYEKAGQPGVPEFVKCGNEGWPKSEQFTVFVRTDETAQAAVLRHKRFATAVAYVSAFAANSDLSSSHDPVGERVHDANSGGGSLGDLFCTDEALQADISAATGIERKRKAPDRFEPNVTLRDQSNESGTRKVLGKALCQRAECVAARVDRDEACAERDKKVAELQVLRHQLFELASQTGGGDERLSVGARGMQMALMEILDL